MTANLKPQRKCRDFFPRYRIVVINFFQRWPGFFPRELRQKVRKRKLNHRHAKSLETRIGDRNWRCASCK